jgi:osmoprotectant transport system ATP-binding protein
MQQHFLRLQKTLGKTALFVTHDLREALLLATRIALLHEGRLELLVKADEFLKTESVPAQAFLATLGSSVNAAQ